MQILVHFWATAPYYNWSFVHDLVYLGTFNLSRTLLGLFQREACSRERSERFQNETERLKRMLQFMIESIRELIICSDHVLDVFLFGKFINQRTSGRFGRESYAAERNSPCLNELEKLWGSSITCLGFFVHYRFSERFQNKTEPLNRQVQFIISMHSECFNLSQSFVLLCSVLCARQKNQKWS